MKTKIVFPFLLLLLACLTGCMHDEDNLGNANPQGSGRVLTVNYSFDAPMTRVTSATSSERQINDVAVLFYKADTEAYVACSEATPPTHSMGSFSLPLPEDIMEGEQYKLIVVGNYKKYKPDGKSLTDYALEHKNLNTTYSGMKTQIYGELGDDERITTIDPLPFYGRLLGDENADITLTGPAQSATNLGISVRFSRAVARFDIVNLAGGSLKITGVKVCNYRSEGHYYLENVAKGDIVRGVDNAGAGYESTLSITTSSDETRQDINAGGLYAFPNTVSYISQDDRQTTFLMIRGKYNGSDDDTYYRVNIGHNGYTQLLQRNYVYTIVINSVAGPGKDKEDEAANEKDKQIDYIVDDKWDEGNGGGTVVDEHGNYLTLSHATVILPGVKDASAAVNVRVKEGTDWEVDLTEGSQDEFEVARVNNSFVITAKKDNTGNATRNAKFTVRVTGISPSTLSQEVRAIQLTQTKGDDVPLLMVDGKTSDFTCDVPGQGATINLTMITGANGRWQAELENGSALNFVNFASNGPNNGTLALRFTPNTTGGPRGGTIIIKRLQTNGDPDDRVTPIRITLTQDKSPYLVTVIPDYKSQGGVTINAFNPANDGIYWEELDFFVILADKENYTFDVQSSFDKNSDAFLSKGPAAMTSWPNASDVAADIDNPSTYHTLSDCTFNDTHFFLNIFKTGPADAKRERTITITAKHNSGDPSLTEIYSFPVTITSGDSKLGIAKIGNFLLADRNVGAIGYSEDHPVGLNYYSYTGSPDSNNTEFMGIPYDSYDGGTVCKNNFGKWVQYKGETATEWSQWRLINGSNQINSEMIQIKNKAKVSKGRVYIVSDIQPDPIGQVYTWFPQRYADNADVSKPNLNVFYRTTSPYGDQHIQISRGGMRVGTYSSSIVPTSTKYPVRCVRNIN